MNLPPDQPVYGVAPWLLIACAQELRSPDIEETVTVTDEQFARALGASMEYARPVFYQMIADGYFTRGDQDAAVTCTPKLSQLAVAKLSSGLSRADADRLLGEIVAKANRVNASRRAEEYGVQAIAVFGSYLGDKPILGDLDIAVAMAEPRGREIPKDLPVGRWLQRCRAQRQKLFSALRLRRPQQISVHQWEEVVSLKAPYRVVYGTPPPDDPA